MALESYWSRSAILWGDAGPVRYLFRPAERADCARALKTNADYLHREIAERLRHDEIIYDLYLQPYVDESRRQSRTARRVDGTGLPAHPLPR